MTLHGLLGHTTSLGVSKGLLRNIEATHIQMAESNHMFYKKG